jgi:serine/threonine-protein kinase
VLGKGGMGVVYRAEQTSLRRIVALKMIKDDRHLSEDARRRFQVEAEAIARFSHANIVQVYEVGEHNRLPYMALEYCPGGSLATSLAGQPLPADDAAELVATLARAVAAAHKKDIIHRDLKPANVLLAEDDTPKITDFGLARRLDEVGHTQSGAIVGTVSYMAPEQAGGGKAGKPADIYGLGAVLYELLTGRPPFKAATVLETLHQVLQNAPAPPSQLNPSVPATLEAICLRCLEKDPAKRYGSALELAEALRSFQEGANQVAFGPAPPCHPTAEALRGFREGDNPKAKPAARDRSRRRWLRAGLRIGPLSGGYSCTVGVAVGAGLAILALVLISSLTEKQHALRTAGAVPILSPVEILSLEVMHIANVKDEADERGVLGKDSFDARVGDHMTLQARLSRPAPALLIAFRADGTEEPFFPAKPAQAPPLTDQPRYPWVDDRGAEYSLDEGEGMHVFAVVVLRRPLSFSVWRAQRGAAPWRHFDAKRALVLLDDGSMTDRLTEIDQHGKRGAGKHAPDKQPLVALTDWLRQAPDVEAVTALAFAVLPKAKP